MEVQISFVLSSHSSFSEILSAGVCANELASVVDLTLVDMTHKMGSFTVNLSVNFLKSRKEICDLPSCSSVLETKSNVRRIYSLVINIESVSSS